MGNSCGCCISPENAPTSPATSPHVLAQPTPSLADSIRLLIGDVNPIQQIDPLINFIEIQLTRMRAPTEASSSSGGTQVESVASSTNLAAQIMNKISTEAQALVNSEIAKEIGSTALSAVKVIGETHWIFVGLSMAAYALERCVTVTSNVKECRELLLTIAEVAKDLKKFREAMPGESEKLWKAFNVVAEGAFMCCQYISEGRASRYWSATTMAEQLLKTRESVRDIWPSFIFTAVNHLARNLTRRSQPSPKNLLGGLQPVGIEEQISDVKELLDMEGNDPAVAVILCGFGGVGKTTLAASVIQNLDWDCTDFKFCRVIIDEKTPDKTSHILKLQRDIIRDFGGGKFDLRDADDGRQQIQRVIQNKCCFLFIDNVVDSDHIKQLLPQHLLPANENSPASQNSLNENSPASKTSKLRIFITTRGSDLRAVLKIQKYKEHPVNTLSAEAAQTLLRNIILEDGSEAHHQFDEAGLMNDVAKACCGVPLLLSVYGNQLRLEREEGSYKGALEALQKGDLDRFADEDHVAEKLLFVYRKMNEEDQQTFLDICVYFHTFDWTMVGNIVEKWKLESFRKRMLVSRSEPGDEVIVHDILRLMGCKEAKNTRFVDYEELEVVLKDESKLNKVKGVALYDNTCLTTLKSSHLNAMQNSLRVLFLGPWVKLDGPPCDGAFQNLRYLQVDDVPVFPFEDLSRMEKLRMFINRSKAGTDLPQLPPGLKYIAHRLPNLDYDVFKNLPLQNVSSLETCLVITEKPVKLPLLLELSASLIDLVLQNCKHLPKTFGHLTALENLDLDKCDMEVLPQGLAKLTKLSRLSLESCRNLTSLSKGFGLLSSLSSLNLNGCTRLEKLPSDFGKLTALKSLCMKGCENLSALPDEFGRLSSLQELDLQGCIKLQRLPESFGELSLNTLLLESLVSLQELPQSIGNLPCLRTLTLISCSSVISLPDSFVRLRLLEILHIKSCIKLSALPKDFGQLSSLKKLIVEDCPNLKELPHGFQSLSALKTLSLKRCNSLVNLPPEFGELTWLENLSLHNLMFSSLPHDFGELKRLKQLSIYFCPKLEALVNEFENLCSLEKLWITYCEMLDGEAMEKILKLQQCHYLNISKSAKLVERWKEMVQQEEEFPMVVCTSETVSEEECQRAARIGLLGGQCMELNRGTDGLIEHPSVLVDKDTTVAVIGLPRLDQQLLQRVMGTAIKTASTASLGQLRIICVRKAASNGQREKEGEEESVKQILKWLPEGSLAIPSTDTRRLSLIKLLFFRLSADDKVGCFMADISVDDKGHQTFVNKENIEEDDIKKKFDQKVLSSECLEEEDEILDKRSSEEKGGGSENSAMEEVSQYSLWLEKLKRANIDHFICSNNSKVMLDQLQGKTICVIICDFNSIECIKLQQIYNEIQTIDSDFQGVWIPILSKLEYGLGMYARALERMSGLFLPNPKLLSEKNTRFIVFDKCFSRIINPDALSTIMGWGVKAYPFTQDRMDLIVSNMYTKSSLEFLLEDIDFHGPQGIKLQVKKESIGQKLLFLYSEPPSQNLKMKSKLEQLVQKYEDFEILYLGYFSCEAHQDAKLLEKVYEDTTKTMCWPKLSFWDMIMFWHRCKYLLNEKEEQLNTCLRLQKILKGLYIENRWLMLLDSNGVVTASGNEVVDMLCKSNEKDVYKVDKVVEGLIESLKSGICDPKVKIFFKDELSDFPQHPQHSLFLKYKRSSVFCDVCYSSNLIATPDQKRIYCCEDCHWDLCGDCWEAYSKEQIQNLT